MVMMVNQDLGEEEEELYKRREPVGYGQETGVSQSEGLLGARCVDCAFSLPTTWRELERVIPDGTT